MLPSSHLRDTLERVIFTDAERVPFHTTPPVEYMEEVTDDEDYKEDEAISIESDSSAAESMLDDDFETTNPLMFDTSLVKSTTGLKQAAEGFEELRKMLPNIL